MIHSVLYYLQRNAEEIPDHQALADESRSFSYKEYLDAVKKIACFVDRNFADGQVKRPVAVLIDRNALSVLAFLGIAASGNFYVPLDPALPVERRKVILSELSPAGILDARTDRRTEICPCPSVSEILEEEEISEADEKRFRIMTESIIDTDPLYSIFTSGSTGVPKGVLICHRSVIDLVNAFSEVFSFGQDTVFGNQAPFDFDVSVKDIYNALYCQGRVEIIPKKKFGMPKLLVEYLAEKEINTLIWAVSAVRIVSDFRTFDKVQTEKPVRLQYVMFSGEVMPPSSLAHWMKHFPEAVFVNLYGPTEITCNCTYCIIEKPVDPDKPLSAGKAFPNTRVFLLNDKNERILEPGVVGQICVEGTGLALGYWNNPQKTAEVFTDHPEFPEYRNMIYRTGDLGYYDDEGRIYFSSRADSQIKHMGHRIELGEVEAALNALDFIAAACCLYDEQKENIVCVFQLSPLTDPEEAEGTALKSKIIKAISPRLPKYMWPTRFVRMDALPLTSHQKTDRVRIRKDYLEGKLG